SSTLTFKPLNEEHAGRYTCVASNAAGKDNASVDVVVNVAPEWVDKPADLKIPEGGVALIHCQAKGSPVPRVSWSHDNGDRVFTLGAIPGGGYDKYRVYSNGTLIVRDVQKSDSGMYTCDVSNGIGIGLKKAVAVTVYTVARAQVLTQHISAESGHTVNLTCIATGDHPVTVVWMKGDKTITSNGQLYDRVLVSSDVQKERLVSSLVMKHVAVGDAGHYVCVVHNEYGEDRKSIRLNVLQPPSNPTDATTRHFWQAGSLILLSFFLVGAFLAWAY
ncbi:neural cell adhesion molecule L1, putative, partial [Ixodes scapularis]